MKSRSIVALLALYIVFGLAFEGASAAVPKVDRFKLGNGIRVVSICMAGSKNVSIFTYLPMGLASDGPGQAQWSHLVEHLVIRTTIPFGSQEGNAETLPDHMRLDFYGTVDNWKEGLSHHAKWLKGVPFTKEKLEAEKPRVNSECDTVAERLATHKFAMAAWAQGYRHGRKHAALKADVNKTILSEIQKYRDRHLAVLDRVVVCVTGGIDAKTLKPIISKELGTIQSQARNAEPVKLHRGDRKMTWDLNARHLVLTWPIPGFKRRDYPALMVASQWLTMKCFSDPELKKMVGMVFAGADLTTPEENFLYISASIKPEASFSDVRRKIESGLEVLRSGSAGSAEIAMLGQQLSFQLTTLMDPAIIKAQAPPNLTDVMIEANMGLQWAVHDFRYGSYRRTLAKRLAAVTARHVSQALRKYLSSDKRSVCTLSPE